MDAKRAARFVDAIYRIEKAAHSLAVAGEAFPWTVTEPGVMDASTTIKAFTSVIVADLSLLYRMIANEEDPEPDKVTD